MDSMNDHYTSEFLNCMKLSGIPIHELKLKVAVSVILLRNIDKAPWTVQLYDTSSYLWQ